MIAFFNSFFVSGLDYITIYPDSISPYQFYYFKTRPRIKEDKDGVPDLRYSMIQGALDQDTNQYGLLLLNTDLGLTPEEERTIRNELSKKVSSSSYGEQMKVFYPEAYERWSYDKNNLNRFVPQIWLSSFPAKSGKSELELMGGLEDDRFKKYQSKEHIPSLSGTFNNTFSASFGDLGAQLMYSTLTGGYTTDAKGVVIPTLSIVRYEMTGEFFVPSLQMTIHVETSSFHTKIKEIIRERLVRRRITLRRRGAHYWIHREKVYLTREAVNEIIQDERKALITIDQADFSSITGGKTTDDYMDKILQGVLDVITGTILSNVFEPAPVPEKDSKDETAKKEVTYTLPDELPKRSMQSFDLTFSKNSTVELTLSANGSLYACVPKKHEDALITFVDLSHTEFMKKSVGVSCQANLYADQIESVVVHCEYDHIDKRFRNTSGGYKKDFEFKKGDESFIFDFFMAKDENGQFLEDFWYKTQVNFIGKEAGKWSLPKRMTETILKVTYENLGYINVKCKVGDVDWNQVDSVFVYLEYPAALNEKDTSTRLQFKEGDGEKTWSCYKYGQASKEYRYKVVFQDKDGLEYPKKPKAVLSTSESLIIDDLYSGQAMEADFRISSIPDSVDYIQLDVYYQDDKLNINKKFSHSFRDDDREWHWQMRLQDGAVEKIRYVYQVVYRNTDVPGTPVEQFAEGRMPDIPIFSIQEGTSLQVTARLLRNWEPFDFAYIKVSYIDTENGINKVFKEEELDDSHISETFEVPCPLDKAKEFTIEGMIYDRNGNMYSIEKRSCPPGFFPIPIPKTE